MLTTEWQYRYNIITCNRSHLIRRARGREDVEVQERHSPGMRRLGRYGKQHRPDQCLVQLVTRIQYTNADRAGRVSMGLG